MKWVSVAVAMLATIAGMSPAAGQEPHPDSLVAAFVESKAWYPARAFEGCPDLRDWQREAFRLLTEAQLSPRRQDDLALALSRPFAGCANAELEAWYFGEMEDRAGDGHDFPHSFWKGIRRADNPRVRQRLSEWMSNDELPAAFRNDAAGHYFVKLREDEKLPAFVAAYSEGRLPTYYAAMMLQDRLRHSPEATLAEMGHLVVEQPDQFLNDQVFELLFSQRALRNVPPAVREAFFKDVRRAAGAARGLTSFRREQLETALVHLEKTELNGRAPIDPSRLSPLWPTNSVAFRGDAAGEYFHVERGGVTGNSSEYEELGV